MIRILIEFKFPGLYSITAAKIISQDTRLLSKEEYPYVKYATIVKPLELTTKYPSKTWTLKKSKTFFLAYDNFGNCCLLRA